MEDTARSVALVDANIAADCWPDSALFLCTNACGCLGIDFSLAVQAVEHVNAHGKELHLLLREKLRIFGAFDAAVLLKQAQALRLLVDHYCKAPDALQHFCLAIEPLCDFTDLRRGRLLVEQTAQLCSKLRSVGFKLTCMPLVNALPESDLAAAYRHAEPLFDFFLVNEKLMNVVAEVVPAAKLIATPDCQDTPSGVRQMSWDKHRNEMLYQELPVLLELAITNPLSIRMH